MNKNFINNLMTELINTDRNLPSQEDVDKVLNTLPDKIRDIVTGDTEEEEEDTEICPCCGAEYDGSECTCCGYPENFGDDEEEFEESVINEAESGPTSLKKAAEKKSIKDWIDSEMTDEIKDDVYEFIKGSDKYYLNDFVTYNQFEKIMFSNGFDDQDYMWKPLIEK